jgi:hypothetical protein
MRSGLDCKKGNPFHLQVQEVKKLLRRMLGQSQLNLEQLQTVVAKAMAVINERPLTYV